MVSQIIVARSFAMEGSPRVSKEIHSIKYTIEINFTTTKTYSKNVLVNMADKAPAQAESVVLAATKAALSLYTETSNTLPGLKPYQPNQRQKVPRNISVTECGGISAGSSSRLPSLS